MTDRSLRLGSFVAYWTWDRARWVRGWMGPKVNGPFLWRLFLWPIVFSWLRKDWDDPIVLPRQARRALQRGHKIHVGGYGHRRRKGKR